jgi:hypothetical protein
MGTVLVLCSSSSTEKNGKSQLFMRVTIFRIHHSTSFILPSCSWADSMICTNEDISEKHRLRERQYYF